MNYREEAKPKSEAPTEKPAVYCVNCKHFQLGRGEYPFNDETVLFCMAPNELSRNPVTGVLKSHTKCNSKKYGPHCQEYEVIQKPTPVENLENPKKPWWKFWRAA